MSTELMILYAMNKVRIPYIAATLGLLEHRVGSE